jgi:hypothetical protein
MKRAPLDYEVIASNELPGYRKVGISAALRFVLYGFVIGAVLIASYLLAGLK